MCICVCVNIYIYIYIYMYMYTCMHAAESAYSPILKCYLDGGMNMNDGHQFLLGHGQGEAPPWWTSQSGWRVLLYMFLLSSIAWWSPANMFQVIGSMEYGLKFSGVASIWDCGIPINWLFNKENDGKPEDVGVPGTLFSDKPFFQSMIHLNYPHVSRDMFTTIPSAETGWPAQGLIWVKNNLDIHPTEWQPIAHSCFLPGAIPGRPKCHSTDHHIMFVFILK